MVWLSTEKDTDAVPATASVFVTVAVKVDVEPAWAGVGVIVPYVRIGFAAMTPYQARMIWRDGVVTTARFSTLPSPTDGLVQVTFSVASVAVVETPLHTRASELGVP